MKFIIAKPHSIYELGQRANQEDNIYPTYGAATTDDTLFIVCDGMGGHEMGEVASSTVCEEMSNYINSHSDGYSFDEQLFQDALTATYDALDKKDNGAEKKMGTTMTFMKFHSGGCLMAHIGDSRMYHIRPSTKEILFQSVDHSLVESLIAVGELTREEAKTSRQRNIITRAIQPNQERRAKAAVREISDIKAGDYFYICTDGMLEVMEDENIVNILHMDNDDDEKIRIFTELTVENRDNHSAYLIHIEDVVCEDGEVVVLGEPAVDNNINIDVEAGNPNTPAIAPSPSRSESVDKAASGNMASYIKSAIIVILLGIIAYFVYITYVKIEPAVHTPTVDREVSTTDNSSNSAQKIEQVSVGANQTLSAQAEVVQRREAKAEAEREDVAIGHILFCNSYFLYLGIAI